MHDHRSPFSQPLYLALALAVPIGAPSEVVAAFLPPQASALTQLRTASLGPVEVTYHAGFPASVLMEVPAAGATPVERARLFLEAYEDFYLQNHPDVTLVYSQSGLSDEEGEIVRFAQSYRGLRVFGAEIVVHVSSDAQGPQRVFGTVGRLFIPARTSTATPIEPAINLTLEISASEAEQAARQALGHASALVLGETILMLYDPSLLDLPGPPRLAWRVGLTNARAVQYLIDANDAAVLYEEQLTETAGGFTDFDLNVIDGQLTNAAATTCWNFGGVQIGDEGGLTPGTWSSDPEAVIAWNAARATYLMFHDQFGRHSYDDDDAELLVAVHAHLGFPMEPNASAGSWCGIQFSNGLVTDDILAHEFGHLVIDETSDLLGSYTPGTLNESYADTMAMLVDTQDWDVGEGVTNPGVAAPIRDFNFPSSETCPNPGSIPSAPCPDKLSDKFILPPNFDSGGVHINAGITNKAFFLMADGGSFNGRSVIGMGRPKMGKLAHRAFINLPCNAGFTALRNAVLGRAQYMFALSQGGITLSNICSVKNAFAAVEIGVGDADCDGVNDNTTDSDNDAILDDGDFSGNTADDRCEGGNTTFCDDNCPNNPNPDQANFDDDWIGDICDTDDDNDGIPDAIDDCPGYPGTTGDSDLDTLPDCIDLDDDGDFTPDLTDNCPFHWNPGQSDGDGNGKGDVCDPDLDGDGVYQTADNCTFVPNPGQENADGDAFGDACDKCPNVVDSIIAYTYPVAGEDPEPYQPDSDSDGIPDACDNLGFGSTGMLNNGQPYGAFNVVAPTGMTSTLEMTGSAGAGGLARLSFPACETGDPAGVEANERVEIVLTGLPPDIRGWVEDGRGRVVGRFRTNAAGTAHGTRFRPRCHESHFILFETLASFDGQEAFTATASAFVPTGDNPWTSNAPLFSDPPPLPPDQDGDGLWDGSDTCPAVYDPTNADADHDGDGDACDSAPGGPITLVFSGVVTAFADGTLPPNYSGIAPGTPFTGRVTYDTTMPIETTAWPVSRSYSQPPPIQPLELRVVVAGFEFSAGPGDELGVVVENDNGASGDRLVVRSGDIAQSASAMESLELTLRDFSTAAFSSLAIPASLDLAQFAERIVQLDIDSGARGGATHMTLTITSLSPPFREGALYWLDTAADAIRRSSLDGSNITTLVQASDPLGFEVDPAGGRIYWTECCAGKIRRSALDGSGVVDIVTGGGAPFGIALDAPGGALVFTNQASPAGLSTVSVGGGLPATLLSTAPSRPFGVAVDPIAGTIYWTEAGLAPRIRRANLDGSGAQDLVGGPGSQLASSQGIALDIPAGKIYWTDLGLDRIYRATLDGDGQQLVADFGSAGLQNPTGIAIDGNRGKLYWADSAVDVIQRANLDGTMVETLLTAADGLSFPRDLFVDPGTDCEPPTEALSIKDLYQGPRDLELTITDANGPGLVTGYNVYRSTKPHLPPSSWPLISLNVADEDTAPGVQWTDPSGNPSLGEIWYYTVVAYNADCPLEGPQ